MIIPGTFSSLSLGDLPKLMRSAFAGGDERSALEDELAARPGRARAFVVPECCATPYFLLSTCPKKGGIVLVSALADRSAENAARGLGYEARRVDVKEKSLFMDPASIPGGEPGILIEPSVFGCAVDLGASAAAAKEKGWILIADASENMRALSESAASAAVGDAVCVRFNSKRNIASLGAGAVFVDDEKWARNIEKEIDAMRAASFSSVLKRAFAESAGIAAASRLAASFGASLFLLREKRSREFGQSGMAHCERVGPAQAAFLLEQLKRADGLILKTVVNERLLRSMLEGAPGLEFLTTGQGTCVGLSLPVLTDKPAEIARGARSAGVPAVCLCEMSPNVGASDSVARGFPNARRILDHLILLPIHPGVEPFMIGHIARSVRTAPANRPS
jgi:dTDP-4-amino-4,6-dideoxygalactose transaminase